RLKLDAERLGRERLIFDQIAHSLASRYDTIYYVDSETNEYSEFSASDPYKELNIPKAGDDFFTESHRNLAKYVHPDDLDGVMHIVTKETILGRLESERMITAEYRLHLGGDYRYTRLSVLWASDRKHFILGIEDINEEKKRETEHQRELRSANEKAMNDELTGVKNMNAYHAAENDLQKAIDEGNIQPFALVICDLNDLKKVNDTYGHKAGDEYIRCASRMICSVFVNSPVFRIGGDEFVVILRRNDYTDRTELLSTLRDEVRGNAEKPNAPMIASGLAEYDPDHHTKVSQVFELADDRMYCNKKELKVMYEGR
ncbi:MAG: diguanylate cyclase, partial [Oscillospiraceae bacterium]|nr:diguanylate cyclase [Oscillospiraceae bacterium]